MRLSRTGSAWARSAASWKISRSSISIRRPYAEISQTIEASATANEEYLERMRRTVEAELRREGIPARVEGRVKRAFSVYQKLKRQKIPIEQVYDLLALRIITDSVKNCYGALGVIHNEWRPVPGRIKDFIAIPRPNLYQSLHTSVVGPGGQALRDSDPHGGDAPHRRRRHRGALEIQGRQARRAGRPARRLAAAAGRVAAGHARSGRFHVHAESRSVPGGSLLLHAEGPRDRAARRGSTPDRFRLRGSLRSRATPASGAKVNGRIVPLRYALRNGDIVDILTQPGHQPSKDWLSIVKTSRARNKIKHVINANERERAIEIGQKYLEKEARRLGVQLSRIAKSRPRDAWRPSTG